ncbi:MULTISPECIES: hypothetical protein [unclassified Adlercreutzia]|nr:MULTISPECIES: hypothetical protein [unclassified Adlercreutzia]
MTPATQLSSKNRMTIGSGHFAAQSRREVENNDLMEQAIALPEKEASVI